ncbi:uncharacterized protein VTP21DRAFT_3749 [Calcarisporiella thermophila]|uniref:uncharacterized protein n=1 Tax=Calcarisporiella thermophila TaxID=911321 RepID=UPI0037427850
MLERETTNEDQRSAIFLKLWSWILRPAEHPLAFSIRSGLFKQESGLDQAIRNGQEMVSRLAEGAVTEEGGTSLLAWAGHRTLSAIASCSIKEELAREGATRREASVGGPVGASSVTLAVACGQILRPPFLRDCNMKKPTPHGLRPRRD